MLIFSFTYFPDGVVCPCDLSGNENFHCNGEFSEIFIDKPSHCCSVLLHYLFSCFEFWCVVTMFSLLLMKFVNSFNLHTNFS